MTSEQCFGNARDDSLDFDPNWTSCWVEKDECICFHPTQGHENGPTDAVKEVLIAPTSLPQTGGGGILSVVIFVALMYVLIRALRK